MLDVGRQLELRDMLLVIDDPGHLGGVEPEFIDQDAAGPDPGRDRVGPHADLLALEVLGLADAGVVAHEETRVMKSPLEEDRDGGERRPVSFRDDVGRRRELADVECDVAHHLPKCEDLRLHLDVGQRRALDRHVAVLEGRCVTMRAQGRREIEGLC